MPRPQIDLGFAPRRRPRLAPARDLTRAHAHKVPFLDDPDNLPRSHYLGLGWTGTGPDEVTMVAATNVRDFANLIASSETFS